MEVFSVRDTGGAPALTRLGGTGNGARYALSPDERSVVLPTGRRVPLSAGLPGRVQSSTVEGATVRIRDGRRTSRTSPRSIAS